MKHIKTFFIIYVSGPLKRLFYSFSSLLNKIKKYWYLLLLIFAGMSTSFVSLGLSTLPLSSSKIDQIANDVTSAAQSSKISYSLSRLSVLNENNGVPFVYDVPTIDGLQLLDFQYSESKVYSFSAYQPSSTASPFSYSNNDGSKTECTVLLNHFSKSSEEPFYYDWPILAGSVPSEQLSSDVIISSSFADSVLLDLSLPAGKYTSLIGREIYGVYSKQIDGTTQDARYSYVVKAVVDSASKEAEKEILYFGRNIVFLSGYTSFPIESSLFTFFGCSFSKNKIVLSTLLGLYPSSSKMLGGYDVTYTSSLSFYSYSLSEGFSSSTLDGQIQKIISFFNSRIWIFSCVSFGITVFCILLECLSTSIFSRSCLGLSSLQVYCIFFILSLLSILVSGPLFYYANFISFIAGTTISQISSLSSMCVFIFWVIEVIVFPFASLMLYRKFGRDVSLIIGKER